MTFHPNPTVVQEVAERMLTLVRPGGYRYSIDDACWWAWEHAFSYEPEDNGHKFWRAVYDVLDQKRRLTGRATCPSVDPSTDGEAHDQ